MRIVLQFAVDGNETDLPLMKLINEVVKACNYCTLSKPVFLMRKGNSICAAKADYLVNFLRDGYEIVAVIQRS